MSVNVENLEKNLVKMTVEVPVEELEKAIDKVYQKNKNRINLPGFRKGKAPRKLIEKEYGADIFLEDAVNDLVPQAYEEACKEVEKDKPIVSRPQITYEQVEPHKPVIFTATVAVKPDVVLGEYKGLEVETMPVEVTEEDVQKKLEEEQKKNSTTVPVEDRPVQDGDHIELDFEGFVEGKPFEGGKGENYSLTIGSHTFIDNFEEQLIGVNVGEQKDVHVTFPEDYGAAELAGKTALFLCKVNSIKVEELPELDDEFASEVSDFDTLEEYKDDIRATLLEEKEKEARTAKEDALVEKVVENAEMEIPDLMVTTQAQSMVQDFEQRLQQQGLTLDQYLQYTGSTVDKMVEDSKDQALKSIQTRLVLEAVVAAEGIAATEEELDHEIEEMAKGYGMEKEDLLPYVTEDQKEQMKENIAVQKALDLIYDTAK